MSGVTRLEGLLEVQVDCFECGAGFRFVGEFPYGYDPEAERIACRRCARRMGDYTMHVCLGCRAQFQGPHAYEWFMAPEACSRACGDIVDMAVERAQERDLAREQACLEAM